MGTVPGDMWLTLCVSSQLTLYSLTSSEDLVTFIQQSVHQVCSHFFGGMNIAKHPDFSMKRVVGGVRLWSSPSWGWQRHWEECADGGRRWVGVGRRQFP